LSHKESLLLLPKEVFTNPAWFYMGEPSPPFNWTDEVASDVFEDPLNMLSCESYEREPFPFGEREGRLEETSRDQIFERANVPFWKPPFEKGVKVVRVSRRKKKPNGIPKRPLCAYNFFVQKERLKLQAEDSSTISFEELGRMIGRRWKDLSEVDRKQYSQLAIEDGVRYRDEMARYKTLGKGKKEFTSIVSKKPEDDCFSPRASDVAVPLAAREQPARVPKAQRHPDEEFSFRDLAAQEAPQHVSIPSHSPSIGSSLTHEMNRRELCFPVPPGMVIYLPDSNGREQMYTVRYNLYSMGREAAERYVESLMPTRSSSARGQQEQHLAMDLLQQQHPSQHHYPHFGSQPGSSAPER
jgi:hypothetical protein